MVLVYEWLLASLFWLGVLLFITGIYWIIFPASFLSLSEFLNRWISTASFFSRLDEQIRLERHFYRHHRVMGVVIILGAGYCLFTLWELARHQGSWFDLIALDETSVPGILADAMIPILGIGNLLALITGIVVTIRPSLLKRLENWSNRWIESDRVTATLDRNMDMTGDWLPQHPRLLGVMTVIGSLYIMSNTAVIALN